MDHIQQATNSPHDNVKVPFIVSEKFQDIIYEHRQVYAEVEYAILSEPRLHIYFLEIGGPETQSLCDIGEILEFFQARCFFGLLVDMFQCAEDSFELEAYLDWRDQESPLVTTKELLSQLDELVNHEALLDDETKVKKFIQFDESMRSTESLTLSLHEISGLESEGRGNLHDGTNSMTGTHSWNVQVIAESVSVLYETLRTTARQMWVPAIVPPDIGPIYSRELPRLPDSVFCRNRFQLAGWCPRQIAEINSTTLKSRSVLFTLSSIDKRQEDHEYCSAESCISDSIDNDHYQTLHAVGCSQRGCLAVSGESDSGWEFVSTAISRAVRKGLIPAISLIEKPNGKAQIKITSFQPVRNTNALNLRTRKHVTSRGPSTVKVVNLCDVPKMDDHLPAAHNLSFTQFTGTSQMFLSEAEGGNQLQYIAISHVWSQGLGNRRRNTLPLCQLRRLQQFADQLVPPRLTPIPFWIDTICVPLDTVVRDVAINSMRHVYRDAMATLVIDTTLKDFHPLNVTTSAAVQDNCLEAWQTELLMRIKTAPWSQRLWTYHEACLARQLHFKVGPDDLPAVWSQDIVLNKGLSGRGSDNFAEHISVGQNDIMPTKRVDKISHAGEPEWPIEARCKQKMPLEYAVSYLLIEAASLQLFGKFSFPSEGPIEFHKDIRYLSRQLAIRTTSRLQDEAVCLSTLMGLEPADVLVNEEGKPVADWDRMCRLWQILGAERIPAEILFCNRPTYEKHGCGWMPRSLLRDDRGSWIDELGCGQVMAKDSDLGILVEMGAIHFQIPAAATDENIGSSRQVTSERPLLPWDVTLEIAEHRYRIIDMRASKATPEWRCSIDMADFAILMPASELAELLDAEKIKAHLSGEGIDNSASEMPFGLLVGVLELGDYRGPAEQASCGRQIWGVIQVVRREMVELQLVFDDTEEAVPTMSGSDYNDEHRTEIGVLIQSPDDLNSDYEEGEDDSEDNDRQVLIEGRIISKEQKWWVG